MGGHCLEVEGEMVLLAWVIHWAGWNDGYQEERREAMYVRMEGYCGCDVRRAVGEL